MELMDEKALKPIIDNCKHKRGQNVCLCFDFTVGGTLTTNGEAEASFLLALWGYWKIERDISHKS